MKAFCIAIEGNEYSQRVARRCVESAQAVGVEVQLWPATTVETVADEMRRHGLKWTWANGNTSPSVCPVTGLKQHPYRTRDNRMRYACSMSHYLLWLHCCRLDEPILILEHDAVFLLSLPEIRYVGSAIMLNDPRGATPRGDAWAKRIEAKGPGIHAKSVVFEDAELVPDGLAGNSAYIIAPHAAAACVAAFDHLGVWPNDATLCRQIVGGLQECYPFVTKVHADKTMAAGY